MLSFRTSAGRPLSLLALVAMIGASAGCYNIRKTQMTHAFRVKSSPPNAFVWQMDKEGKRAAGKAPMTLHVPYERNVRHFSGNTWWHLLLSGAGLAGSIVAANSSESGVQALGIVGITIAGLWALGSIGGLIGGYAKPERDITISKTITVGSSLPGYADAYTVVKVPGDKKSVHLEMMPAGGAVAKVPLSSSAPPKTAVNKRPIVAVFAVEDSGGKMDRQKAEELAEYLSIQLTATGKFRTIPRAQLRKRLSDTKKQGYKACYDQACQIELGKALAAQKSLATKILKVGSICTLTSVLFDLRTETSEGAATAEVGCKTAELLGGLKQVAAKLAKSR